MAKGGNKDARFALKLSLDEACHHATELLGNPPSKVREPLLDAIRVSLDGEMAVRLDGRNEGKDKFPEPPLQFSQFRNFYTSDDYFDEDLLDGVTGKEPLDWKERLTKRLAAFALLRAAEGSAQVRSSGSRTPEGLLAVACAAVDSWQALALARVREKGGADALENSYDQLRRKKAISKAGLATRLTAKAKLEEKVGQLTDEHRKRYPEANNLKVAVAIHPQVVQFAEEIGYRFQTKGTPGDNTPYAARIERMIGRVRPKHRKD